jgi:hypothetical protein
MGFSTFGANGVSNAMCNNTSFAVAQMYVKLHIGVPGVDGTTNAAGETTRKAVSTGASASGVCTSDADMTWTNVASTETIAYVSCWDASTAGNCLATGALTSSRAVTAGDTLQILTGAFTFTSTPVGA